MNSNIKIILALGLMALGIAIIWKPAITGQVTVGNESNQTNVPPFVVISNPIANASIINPVLLQGNATDFEDGILNTTVWSENSLILGFGNSLEVNLSLGMHNITLTATDSANSTGFSMISFNVITNTAPVPVINYPGANTTVSNPVTLQGNVTDLEETLVDSALVWKENETAIGTGYSIGRSFSPGQHTITLLATDSQNASGETSVTFSAKTCHVEVDQNSNSTVDTGDFVLLMSHFANKSLPCGATGAQNYCIIEFDISSNGMIDIGDFVLLQAAHTAQSINDINGQSCYPS